MASMVSALADQPLAFRAYIFFSFGSHTMAKRSPPMPFIIGSMTPTAAFAAIAASTALPPLERIVALACEARV
jgi:hypothetical protein